MDGVAHYRRSTFSAGTSQHSLASSSSSSGSVSAGSSGATGGPSGAVFFPRRSSFATSGASAARDVRPGPLALSSQAQKSSSLKRGSLQIPKRAASQRSKSKSAAAAAAVSAATSSRSKIYDTPPYFSAGLSNTAASLPVAATQGLQDGRAFYDSALLSAEQTTFSPPEETKTGDFGLTGAVTPPDSGTATPTSSSASGPSSDDLLDVRAMQFFEQSPDEDAALPDDDWLARSSDRGFVRVLTSDGSYSGSERCLLETTASELADRIGSKWLFVCDSSGSVRRLAGGEKPLVLQVEKLREMGYEGSRLQQYGQTVEAGHCIRFYDGKHGTTLGLIGAHSWVPYMPL